jgi:hypothetical protein
VSLTPAPHALAKPRAPNRQKFLLLFSKRRFFLVFFFEKKNQKTFASLEAHRQPAAVGHSLMYVRQPRY